MTHRSALSALALSFLLAGCLGASQSTSSAPPTDLLSGLALTVPAFAYNATEAVAWWESFVTTYSPRIAGTPQNEQAAGAIAAELRQAGLEVEIRSYPFGAMGANAPAELGPAATRVVVATKVGRDPNHAIAIGGHYDTAPPPFGALNSLALLGGVVREPGLFPLQAAYDNGSGTAVVVSLCKELAKLELDRTLVCLLFDAEEVGTVGSTAYVEDADRPELDLYLGFDMNGINWPGVDPTQPGWELWKLYAWTGGDFAESLHPFVNRTLHQVLGWPLSGVEAFDFNDRNSDEASFASAGIPTVRFAGGRTADLYPEYHDLDDTVAYVDAFVGGRANFEKGFAATVQAAYTIAVMFDATTLAALEADAA